MQMAIENPQNKYLIRPILAIDLTCQEIKIQDLDSSRARRPHSIVIRDFVTRHMFCFGENHEKIKFLNAIRKHRRELKVWHPIIHSDDLKVLSHQNLGQQTSGSGYNTRSKKASASHGLPTITETSANSSGLSSGSGSSGSAMRLLNEKGYVDTISPRSRKRPNDRCSEKRESKN